MSPQILAGMANLRGRITEELGIPGGNVTVSASHTHPLGCLPVDDDEQLDHIVGAINEALEKMAQNEEDVARHWPSIRRSRRSGSGGPGPIRS
ncbi:MAG TPA: hypothetical protein DIT01_20355 [Lentisphaeria bacterium]|nr:hypothetical protein [Lentisphaeria bacterium]|tara:strand:- start:1101 stop:1379 length:279 start_codon:yes stop_codon:yes gene_type:complete